MTKDGNILLTEQILQLLVELWKIIVLHFRGAAALMIDSAMKGSSERGTLSMHQVVRLLR